MNDEALKELFDFYSLEDKNDFYIAYMYLKHMDRFIYNVLETLGVPTAEPEESADTSLDDLLKSYVQQIAETAPDPETNIYHGKIMTHNDARKLVTLEKGIHIPVSEKVVPFKIARDVILENPEAIAVGRCACRKNQVNPCIPVSEQEVCLIMGDPFAQFIAAHNPDFRMCPQEEAVRILEKAHKRGDVHTGYFKKEMGKRLMALCNCCSCCCMGMLMWNKLNGAVPFLAPSGYSAKMNDNCTGCELCVEKCPFNAIEMNDKSDTVMVIHDKCMGCGICESVCTSSAITLFEDESKGNPLDIDSLLML